MFYGIYVIIGIAFASVVMRKIKNNDPAWVRFGVWLIIGAMWPVLLLLLFFVACFNTIFHGFK